MKNNDVDRMDRGIEMIDSVLGIRKSLAHELAMIAIPFKSTEGVLNRCERNAKMAELLDERVRK